MSAMPMTARAEVQMLADFVRSNRDEILRLAAADQAQRAQITDGDHLIVYTSGLEAAGAADERFVKKLSKRCSGAVDASTWRATSC